MTESELMTPKQVAKYLSVGVGAVHALRRRGDGPPCVRVNHHTYVYRRSDVEIWLKQSTARVFNDRFLKRVDDEHVNLGPPNSFRRALDKLESRVTELERLLQNHARAGEPTFTPVDDRAHADAVQVLSTIVADATAGVFRTQHEWREKIVKESGIGAARFYDAIKRLKRDGRVYTTPRHPTTHVLCLTGWYVVVDGGRDEPKSPTG